MKRNEKNRVEPGNLEPFLKGKVLLHPTPEQKAQMKRAEHLVVTACNLNPAQVTFAIVFSGEGFTLTAGADFSSRADAWEALTALTGKERPASKPGQEEIDEMLVALPPHIFGKRSAAR